MTSGSWNGVLPTFSSALSVVGTIAVAVATWYVANYWGKLLQRFWELRREAYEVIFLYANVRVGHPADLIRARDGDSHLREVSARVDALRAALPATVSWYLRRCGYDLHHAAHGLTGLSNSLGSNEGDVVRFRVEALTALRFSNDPADQERVEREQRLDGRLI